MRNQKIKKLLFFRDNNTAGCDKTQKSFYELKLKVLKPFSKVHNQGNARRFLWVV